MHLSLYCLWQDLLTWKIIKKYLWNTYETEQIKKHGKHLWNTYEHSKSRNTGNTRNTYEIVQINYENFEAYIWSFLLPYTGSFLLMHICSLIYEEKKIKQKNLEFFRLINIFFWIYFTYNRWSKLHPILLIIFTNRSKLIILQKK